LTGPRLGGVDAEREAQLLSRVIDTISGGLELGPMLQGVTGLVTEATGTDVCFVHLLDEGGRTLRLSGATPPFDGLVGKIELGLGEGVSGWVASHAQPAVIVDNKTADPRYRYIPALRGEDFTSMVSVPIVAPSGHMVGVLNVHTRQRREFTTADVELLRSVAGLVAGTIENAQLHRRLAEREEALERFAERTVEWQEQERRRLAAEIHDGISQRIVSLFFHLSAAADAIPAHPGSPPSRSRWPRNWPPPPSMRPGRPSPGCARRSWMTSAWPPAWRAWRTRSRSSTCRCRPPTGGWPSTWRRLSTGPRRRRCRTRPSTPTRTACGSGSSASGTRWCWR
jgi:putative methionine-R-sulfoxide reductase with GAF domain